MTLRLPCSHFERRDNDRDAFEVFGSYDEPILNIEPSIEETDLGIPYIAWEYEYILHEIGPYQRCLQQLHENKQTKKKIDRLVVHRPDKLHCIFYFDITLQMNTINAILEKAGDVDIGEPPPDEEK